MDYNNRSKQSLPSSNVTNTQYTSSSSGAVTFREDSFTPLGIFLYKCFNEIFDYFVRCNYFSPMGSVYNLNKN